MRRFKLEGLAAGLLVSAGAFGGACGGETATSGPAVAPTASAAAAPAPSSATSAPAPAASAPAPAASATSAAAAPSPEDEDVSADLGEYHRHHHHGGVTMFIAMSLDSLGVAPDQAARKIEKIQGDLFAKMEPARVAEQKVLNILADWIVAGKSDEPAVKGAIEGVKTASIGVHDAAAKSLNELHAVLTPEQRATLVEKVEAHWEVWKSSNNQDEAAGDDAHPGHLDRVAKDLNLTSDQVTKIRATFGERLSKHPLKFDASQVEAHLEEFGKAFESEKFDAKLLKHGPFAQQHVAVWGAWRMAHFYEAIAPVLTPEQRAKLSAEMKEHAAAKSGILDADKHER